MSNPQPISGMPSWVSQELPINGREIDPTVRREETREETVLAVHDGRSLAAYEQGLDPATTWNRNFARFRNTAQPLGTTLAQNHRSASVLTDEMVDNLVLVLTDDPDVGIEEIDAARAQLLDNPNVLDVLMDMDPEETMRLLGSDDPTALANFDVLRDDFEIRRLMRTALGDRVAALETGDYDTLRSISDARSALLRHPRAFTVLPQILAAQAPESADVAASIVIENPGSFRRLEELLRNEDVEPSIRERGLGALPRIAEEAPELEPDIRHFLSECRQTDGAPQIRDAALRTHHRLGYRDYGEATELVGGLTWTLSNDPDPDLRVSAVYHLAQVAREIGSGTSYPDQYPVELEASDGEALIRHIREDVLEQTLSDCSQPDVTAAIRECLETLP